MHVHTYCSSIDHACTYSVAILTRHVLGIVVAYSDQSLYRQITSYHKVGQWEETATYYQVNCKALIGVHSTMHLMHPIKGLQFAVLTMIAPQTMLYIVAFY